VHRKDETNQQFLDKSSTFKFNKWGFGYFTLYLNEIVEEIGEAFCINYKLSEASFLDICF
jgi:hypothetical protein